MSLSNYPPGCTTADLPGWGRICDDYEQAPECCALGCGEWIDDESIAEFGPAVYVRDAEDGKLAASHAECAAAYVIDCEIDQHTTREQIAMAVYRAEGFNGAEAWLLSFVEEMALTRIAQEASPCAS